MAFLETDPRNRRQRRAVASRCKPRREERWIGAVTVGLVRYMVSGRMPKPGTCVSMTTHSKYGMYHPFALDGKNGESWIHSCLLQQSLQNPLGRRRHRRGRYSRVQQLPARAYADIRVGRCAGGAHARPQNLSTLCMQRPGASNNTSPTLPFCAMTLHSVGGARRPRRPSTFFLGNGRLLPST